MTYKGKLLDWEILFFFCWCFFGSTILFFSLFHVNISFVIWSPIGIEVEYREQHTHLVSSICFLDKAILRLSICFYTEMLAIKYPQRRC